MAKKVYVNVDEEIVPMTLEELASAVVNRYKKEEGSEIPAHEVGEGDEAQSVDGAEVITFLVEGVASGETDVDWSQFSDKASKAFQKAFAIIEEMIGDNDKNKEEFEKNAAEAKEKAKKSKEQEKERIELRKTLFVKAAEKGVEEAKERFIQELNSLKEHLPKGANIVTNDVGGSGITFDEGSTEESIAETMAFCAATANNNEYLTGQLQFYGGAAVNESVRLGIFRSNAEASKFISAQLEESMNYRIGPRTLENYARMDERVPIEMRNIQVDPSAYFAVASAGSPKQLKNESKEDYKKRIEAHEADRLKLLSKMKEGRATIVNEKGEKVTQEIRSRADILPLVTNMQIQHKILKPKDPNEMTVADYLKQFFFSFMAKEYLEGVVEEDTVVFLAPKDGHPNEEEIEIATGDKIKIVKVDSSTLTDWMEEAKNNLQNILFAQQGITMKEFMEGVTTAKVPRTTEVEGKTIPVKDAITKKPLTDSVEIPAYPNWPFTKAEPDNAPEEVEEEEAA